MTERQAERERLERLLNASRQMGSGYKERVKAIEAQLAALDA